MEAISTVNEDLEPTVLNYMLYYVLVRSENAEQMQYKYLIELVDSLIEASKGQRAQSAIRKNRPESSSPDKIKMRNPQMVTNKSGQSQKEDGQEEEEEDNYSDEEIANDSDEGDDGTNKLGKVVADDDDDDEDTDEQYVDEFEKIQK